MLVIIRSFREESRREINSSKISKLWKRNRLKWPGSSKWGKLSEKDNYRCSRGGRGIAGGPGLSSGNPHQIPQDLHDHTHDKRPNKICSRFTNVSPIRVVHDGFYRLGHGVIRGVSTITGGVRRLSGQVEDHIPSAVYGYQAGGGDSSTNRLLLENKLPSNFGKLVKHGNPKLARMEHRERGDQHLLTMKLCLGRMATAALNGLGPYLPLIEQYRRRQSLPCGKSAGSRQQSTHLLDGCPSKEYPKAFNKTYANDKHGDPLWKQHLSLNDRPMMTLPPFGVKWLPSLPPIGKKVDTIYYCRKEVARLNVEIEQDQSAPVPTHELCFYPVQPASCRRAYGLSVAFSLHHAADVPSPHRGLSR
ncbi:unnamed protein product [Tuber aestivum]|uniref:Uncharacterized protein n=1 Tax=Tuber aestivum TaxID=59557 RepID=A0A292PJU2_9PEZI|nr:unnamed protein product [Tuber aestivum]